MNTTGKKIAKSIELNSIYSFLRAAVFRARCLFYYWFPEKDVPATMIYSTRFYKSKYPEKDGLL